MGIARNNEDLIRHADAWHSRASAAHRELFRFIVELDLTGAWEDSGARDLRHWLSMRYGISYWKARRWIEAAHGLVDLPLLSEAFASGELGVDKVVELARFATPETERHLIAWAKGVSVGAIRHRGDVAKRKAVEEVREAERCRYLRWWRNEDRATIGLGGELPVADGMAFVKKLDHLAKEMPVMPGEDPDLDADARRADALVALASIRTAEHQDPDPATVVVHARVGAAPTAAAPTEEAWSIDDVLHRGIDIEDGPAIHPETALRLMCSGRIQALLEDGTGNPVKISRITRDPPRWMLRQLKYRDRECQFPGCGSRRFLHPHHIMWVEHGGKTKLENLILLCSFRHKLVHEFGWRVERKPDGIVQWFRPSGIRYEPGPAVGGKAAAERSFDWRPRQSVGRISLIGGDGGTHRGRRLDNDAVIASGDGVRQPVLEDPVPT